MQQLKRENAGVSQKIGLKTGVYHAEMVRRYLWQMKLVLLKFIEVHELLYSLTGLLILCRPAYLERSQIGICKVKNRDLL